MAERGHWLHPHHNWYLTASHDDEAIEYMTDPGLVHEKYSGQVDAVVGGGLGHLEASTVIDCTSGEPEVVREGRGALEGVL